MDPKKPTKDSPPPIFDTGDNTSQIPQFQLPTSVLQYPETSADNSLANRLLGLVVYFSQMVDAFVDTVERSKPTKNMYIQLMMTLGTFGRAISNFSDKSHHFILNKLPTIMESILQKISLAMRSVIECHNKTGNIVPIIQLSAPLLAEITGDEVRSEADAFDGLIRASWATFLLFRAPDSEANSVLAATRLDRSLILLVAADRIFDSLLLYPESQRKLLHNELELDQSTLKIIQSYSSKFGSTRDSVTMPFKTVATELLERMDFLTASNETIKKETGLDPRNTEEEENTIISQLVLESPSDINQNNQS